MINDKALWTFHQTKNHENFKVGHPRQDMLFDVVRKVVARGRVIIESGFGDGYLLGRLQDRYRCIGVDISPENVKNIAVKFPAISFHAVNTLTAVPVEDSSVDCFIASEVFEHMTDEELSFSTSELQRILRPGGVAILTFPAREKLSDNICFCPNCGMEFHKWGHKQVWDDERVRHVFSAFSVVKISEFFTPYKGISILERMLGFVAYIARNILSKVIPVPGAHYLVIVKKNESS